MEEKKDEGTGTLRKDKTLLRDEKKMEKLKQKLHTDDERKQNWEKALEVSWGRSSNHVFFILHLPGKGIVLSTGCVSVIKSSSVFWNLQSVRKERQEMNRTRGPRQHRGCGAGTEGSLCVPVNWLDHGRTLREQGVEEHETLLLRRKFFYSDQNVDSRDPVQLNLLYVQVRGGRGWDGT